MVVWNDLSNTQWLDYPSQSNILRRTYVNGFLDVSQNIVARKDLELKGNIKIDGAVEGITVNKREDYNWNAYGQVLSGNYESDNAVNFGLIVDMDASGNTIIVGANKDNSTGFNGAAYVYKYDSDADLWYQHGPSLTPDSSVDSNFGWAGVFISDDGSIVAVNDYSSLSSTTSATSVGKIYVFQYNSSTNAWDDYGLNQSVLVGSGQSENFGNSGVSMSGDGSTIAGIEQSGDDSVHIYKIVSGSWTQIGTFGTSSVSYVRPSLNYNGSRVVFNDFTNEQAYVYDYSGSGTIWTQVGSTITNTGGTSHLSFTSINKEGNIIAVQEQTNQTIRIYQFVDTDWVQLGSTLSNSYGSSGMFGEKMRLNAAGDMIIVGDRTNSTVDIFKYQNDDWVMIGDTITGIASSTFGRAVAISDDGSKIVAGGYLADLNTTNSGYVQAFQWSKKAPYTNPSNNDNSALTIWGSAAENPNNWGINQLGQVLYGNDGTIVEENTNVLAGMGASPSLNADGTILATSALYTHNNNHNRYEGQILVFKYRNGTWSKIGTAIRPYTSIITSPGPQVYTGWTLELDNLGTTIAFCTYADSNGTLEVYKYFNGDWIPKGSTVGNYLHGASISGNGNVVAGATRTDLHAYQYIDASNSWVRMGNDIEIGFIMNINVHENDRRVDLNDTGDIMAIGYYGEDTSGLNTGSVFVYKYDGTFSNGSWSDGSWNLLGNEIYLPESSSNSTTADLFGKSVSLSSDGYTIVSTSANYDGNAGRARVMKYSEAGNVWESLGSDITLSNFADTTGTGIASRACISGDGKTVLINNINSDVNATDAGSVSILKYIDGDWKEVQSHHHNVADHHYGMTIALSKDGKRFAGGNKDADSTGIKGFLKVHEIEKNPTLKVVNGNVGIGTTSPGSSLHIHDNSLPVIRLSRDDDSHNGFQIYSNSTAAYISMKENLPMNFETNLATRMTILGNGNVGIGTNNPGATLHIMDGPICVERNFDPGNDNGEAGLVFKESGYNNCFYMAYDAGGTAGTDNEHLTFYNSGSSDANPTAGTGNQVVRMWGNGNVRLNGFYGKVTSNNSVSGWTTSNYGTAAMRWQCIGPHSANASRYWDLQMWKAGHFYFSYTNSHKGYVSNGGSNSAMNFTGQHRSYIEEIPFSEGDQYIGLIACANKNKYINVKDEPIYGKEAITINESLPLVSLCRKEKDKSCFGVISQVEDNNETQREYSLGTFVSLFGKQYGDNRFYINSVGEGALWVSNKNGNLESGDYITTSSVSGYGEKQDDDILHNYTVAKITMDCDFNPQLKQKKRILRRVIDFTFDMSSNNYYDVSGNDTIYTKPTLDDNDNDKTNEYRNPVYSIVVDDSYNLIDARQNILDANGEIQWEDTEEQERAYEIRHIDQSGNILTEDEYNVKIAASEEAYIAAFVGCTYHCG